MAIVRAIVAGERDPARLAEHRDGRCRKSLDEIANALQYLLDYGTADLSDETKDMYRLHMGHLVRVLVDRDVGKFRIEDSQEYIQTRLKEGAHRETVRKELVTLRRGLTLAHERKILAADPRGLVPKFRVRYVPKDRFLTEAEFSWIMQALAPTRRLWVALAVYTGGRLSEVERISWEYVDLANRRLLLPGTKTNKSRRWVPMHEPLALMLEEIHEDARTGPVVPPWSNVRRDLNALVRAYNKAQAKAAAAEKRPAPPPMRNISPNDLRRTFASWLKQAGVDSMVVAKLLGHTTSRMVELVYGHLNDATTSAAITKLPAPPAPSLAEPAARAVTVPVRRRRGVAGEAPTLKLAGDDAAAPPPIEPMPRGRSRAGRVEPAPGSGSKWAVRPLRNERPERRMRQPESQSSSEVTVPRVGIEPTTRGFSGPCPRHPRPRLRSVSPRTSRGRGTRVGQRRPRSDENADPADN